MADLDPSTPPPDEPNRDVRLRHVRWGWWLLASYIILGSVLEALHGFKVGGYLDVTNHTRRLMWTLAGAHGTLLGLLNVAFAFTLGVTPLAPPRRRLASRCLLSASVLLPLGFFLAGIDIYAGDPGFGIVFAGLGGLLLVVAVLAIATGSRPGTPPSRDPLP